MTPTSFFGGEQTITQCYGGPFLFICLSYKPPFLPKTILRLPMGTHTSQPGYIVPRASAIGRIGSLLDQSQGDVRGTFAGISEKSSFLFPQQELWKDSPLQ